MDDAAPDQPDAEADVPAAGSVQDDDHHGSLRGAFTAVLMMGAFFVLVWFGMFLLALERR